MIVHCLVMMMTGQNVPTRPLLLIYKQCVHYAILDENILNTRSRMRIWRRENSLVSPLTTMTTQTVSHAHTVPYVLPRTYRLLSLGDACDAYTVEGAHVVCGGPLCESSRTLNDAAI